MSEYAEVELPFLRQLAGLDWQVIDQGPGVPQTAAASLRHHFRQWILPEVFAAAVRSINLTEEGREWLTDRQLEDLYQQLLRQPNRTLLEANEAVQSLLFKAQVDVNELTGECDPVVRLIDFHHPDNNQFHAINQFRIDTPGGVKEFIIPDIVLFVNGIPLCVVECKKGSATCANPMQEALEQLRRYMNRRPETAAAGLREGEPRLFHSNLLVIRTSGLAAEFGTITADETHFYAWKTLYPLDDAASQGLDGQGLLVAGLLNRPTLLTILRCCSVFMDLKGGYRVKVVCRYQQFRAAMKMMQRLRTGQTARDRGGVIWQTQGSGKSLTMVFLARMLRASADLSDYKVVMVIDRQDLETQLGKTARLIGGKVKAIESRRDLRDTLATDSSDINLVMIHKFAEHKQALSNALAEALGTFQAMPAGQTFGVVNPSERIILLIDEAHRTQGSEMGNNLFEAFPQATRVAFTGTPLMTERHGNRRTHKRFGEYIDTYRLMDAVNDGATLQILYEGRTAETALTDKAGMNQAFEDLFRPRSDEEMLAIRKKYGATGDILEAEQRIQAIARDLVKHYVDKILPNGFKAQVVCHSKLACVRYRIAIEAALAERVEAELARPSPDAELVRRLRFLKAVVVISSDGVNEAAYVTEARKRAARMNAVENFCRAFDLDDPDQENTGIAFLIVCDMLLTGFDAPIEQVMYIDKKLREHNLLQAIARTNRVRKGKQRGFIVDYIGLANHLAEALTLYAVTDELQELHDGLRDITAELPVLEERYQRLLQHFIGLGVKRIKPFVNGQLDSLEEDAAVAHAAVKALKDERARADFEVYLRKFLMSLDIVLPDAEAQPYRVPASRFGYILQVARERYKDTSLDLGDAGEKVKALINAHLISLGIQPKIPPIELMASDFLERLNQHAGGNLEAKASEMEHAIRRHCTVHHDEDPAFYQNLAEKMEALIQQHQEDWEVLVRQLEGLRREALAGRTGGRDGMTEEATIFHDLLAPLVFDDGETPDADSEHFRALMETVVSLLRSALGSLDFWQNPDKQRRVRGLLKQEMLKSPIEALKLKRERVAVEIMKLAKNRHAALLRSQAGEDH